MVTGILICHGQLAFELIRTVEKILGPADSLLPFSNEGLSPKTLYDKVMDTLAAKNVEQAVIMVDLRGGSCWMAAKMINKERPTSRVLSGVNVPMLVSFLTKHKQLSFNELVETIEADTHRGVVNER